MRDHYEYKDAMFSNSLFSDFLKQNGLKVWKDESTRDIICLEFNYGSRSYEKELSHIYKIANNAHKEQLIAKAKRDKYLIDKANNKQAKIANIMYHAYKNKKNYFDNKTDMIRNYYYTNGVSVEYITRNRNGEIIKRESIHYKMLYRSTGKAKKGSCMFIRDSLYKKAINFLRMGIKLPKKNPMIVEISAYSPLISSSIVGKVKIDPKNILILKDIDRTFKTNVISVETDTNKHCIAKRINDYVLKNTLFDGQALIDSSIFPDWGNGYILLRHHFCKMAAFETNIQTFFMEYFGENYSSATIKDMFGVDHYVKDIQLITTDNAMKWCKFDVSYDYWCEWINKNGNMFGVVKTAHESKLGSVQKMSYQMVNALDTANMENIVKESIEYINKLKQDDNFFLEYLKKNTNFSNDYDVLIALCEHNHEFIRSSYFRNRKSKIIEAYILNMKSGKIIQNAENLTIVGSPYAMLLYAASGNPEIVDNDDTFHVEQGAIQCYTKRFSNDEYLAEFRSPFNGRNNMGYLHNVYDDRFDKYFNLGRQVIAVNMIGTDFQDRNNGSDMDSDSIYTTNQEDIVSHAKYCYENYLTIVNNIQKESNQYENTMDCFSQIDNNLAKSQRVIGESSNLAQIALTYSYNFDDEKYANYVCIFSVLAQVAIDNAKRRFDIDLDEEIKRIKRDLSIKKNGYPSFWKIIKKDFNGDINKFLKCPMSYLYDLRLNEYRPSTPTLPMSDFFIKHNIEINRITCKRIESIIQKYSFKLYKGVDEDDEQYLLLRSDFDDLIFDLSQINIGNKYAGLMSWLIDRAFIITPDIKRNRKRIKSKLHNNKSLLIKTLYTINSKVFLSNFVKNGPF
ncbi:MAG: hypothetical protein LUH21_04060 [Clostridiales bacterium]|nr:hypothetical protein [Clostridiales bacterium]